MAKAKIIYTCQNCGAQRSKWEGRCTDCGKWDTFVEEDFAPPTTKPERGWAIGAADGSTQSTTISEAIQSSDATTEQARLQTGMAEADRVFGGGLVRGSFVLLGGDPGIGKSTLVLQVAGTIAKNRRVLYVSGEESIGQTALRAQRLGVDQGDLHLASESSLENIERLAQKLNPAVLVVDSIQTVFLPTIPSCPGSVSQVRECAGRLMVLSKEKQISTLMIGHVTKDGHIAGPKTLEHMVDTVLSFEGDMNHQYRLLRAVKNRFGPTHELGVFQMASKGLIEVSNPSQLFLEQRVGGALGSAVLATVEGTRPILCEVQALGNPTPLAMPRRTSLGIDVNRVHLLTAVLEKHVGVRLSDLDLFVNIVGGLKVVEPAADMAVAAAILSSAKNLRLDPQSCFFGEIGLTGEIRAVPFADLRLSEAHKLGFSTFYVPAACEKHLREIKKEIKGSIHWIRHVQELDEALRGERVLRPQGARGGEDKHKKPAEIPPLDFSEF